MEPRSLEFVSGCFKTQRMCNNVVRGRPWLLKYVPDHIMTQELCYEAVHMGTRFLSLNCFKTQEMWDEVVEVDPYSLQFVLDWFVSQQQINVWYGDHCNDNELIDWPY